MCGSTIPVVRAARDVLEEMRQVHQQLISVVEDFPGDVRIERIEPKHLLEWVDDRHFLVSGFFGHPKTAMGRTCASSVQTETPDVAQPSARLTWGILCVLPLLSGS
jgi:hypothetical protein